MNEIYIGDGIAGLASLDEHSVDMLLTDPPYGRTMCDWDTPLDWDAFWEAAHHAVKPDGAVCIFTQIPASAALAQSNLAELRYNWTWIKNIPTGFLNAKRMPLKTTEEIYVFYRRLPTYNPQWEWRAPYGPRYSGKNSDVYRKQKRNPTMSLDGRRYPTNVLRIDMDSKYYGHGRIHPTQKPVALMEYLIRTYTNAGDLVADCCAGSGTTAVAAVRTGRRYICWETDSDMAKAAQARVQAAIDSGMQITMDDVMRTDDQTAAN